MADTARQSLLPNGMSARSSADGARPFQITRFGREILAMTLLFLVYKFGRVVYETDVGLAYDNAQRVWEIERFFRLPSELHAQEAMLAVGGAIEFANTYYAIVHIPGTIAFLVWMYLRRPLLYPTIRRALIALTTIALLAHLAFPLAPPRMRPDLGFVDTAAIYAGPNVYGGDPDASVLINHYAAMPSLHVGWAMLVAAGLIASFNSHWRWLWLLHPTITFLAVVGTANHYWLDGIIACLVLAVVAYFSPQGSLRRFLGRKPEDPEPSPWDGSLQLATRAFDERSAPRRRAARRALDQDGDAATAADPHRNLSASDA